MLNLELIGAVELGLIFALVTLGVYLTFRISDFPDLTVDGSFPLGAGLCAKLLIAGIDPMIAIMLAMVGGALAGLCTGLLHIRFKIAPLLSGIITMIALYSINLRVMGSANLSFFGISTVFADLPKMGVLMAVVGLILLLLGYFLSTEFGLGLRAAGTNPHGSEIQGVNANAMKLIALMLSNGMVALAGALYAQSQGFSDISMGTGVIILGIASLVLGEALIKTNKIIGALLGCIVGTVLYRVLITMALHTHILGLKASDLNLITAVLIVVLMWMPKHEKRN